MTTPLPTASPAVPRTQDRMTHDVWLPEEIVALRTEARDAVERRLVPHERMQTIAEETADGFVVNGRKRWITNSIVARRLIGRDVTG